MIFTTIFQAAPTHSGGFCVTCPQQLAMSHNQQRVTSNYKDPRPSLRRTQFTRTEHAQLAAYLVSRTDLVLDQFPTFGIGSLLEFAPYRELLKRDKQAAQSIRERAKARGIPERISKEATHGA